MKLRPTSFLAILLALFIMHTGLAQAELLLCQNKCEQSQLRQAEIPECCRGMKDADHTVAQANDHGMPPSDCPHVDSNSKISESLTFLVSSAKIPAPTKSPAFAGTVPTPLVQLYNVRSRHYQTSSGLSPPDIAEPPSYLLYCSFLI